MEMYKRIASIRSEESRDDLVDELIDRFGDPKKPVMNLIDIAQLKALCSRLAIDYVTCKGASLVMRFSISAEIDFVSVLTAVKRHRGAAGQRHQSAVAGVHGAWKGARRAAGRRGGRDAEGHEGL